MSASSFSVCWWCLNLDEPRFVELSIIFHRKWSKAKCTMKESIYGALAFSALSFLLVDLRLRLRETTRRTEEFPALICAFPPPWPMEPGISSQRSANCWHLVFAWHLIFFTLYFIINCFCFNNFAYPHSHWDSNRKSFETSFQNYVSMKCVFYFDMICFSIWMMC